MVRHFIPLLMLVFPLLSSGQVEFTASRQPGLQIYQAKTVHGKVVVQLPDDMRPGETISGSVIAEPAPSKDPEKVQRHRAALDALQFAFAGVNFLARDQHFQAELPAVPQAVLTLAGENGFSGSTTVELLAEERLGTIVTPLFPEYLRAGEFQRILGNFDGSHDNSQLMLGETELPILAESPGEVVTMIPREISGKHTLSLTEKGETFERELHVIRLDMKVNASTLSKGESTSLQLSVSGLAGYTQPVTVEIENLSPANISLKGGNYQELVFAPSEAPSEGGILRTIPILATASGGFTVSGILGEPQFMEPAEPVDINREGVREICGKTWESVKEVGKPKGPMRDKENPAPNPNPEKQKMRCEQCSKKVEATISTYPLYKFQKEEVITYVCSMEKGHTGECHGSGKISYREKRLGPVGFEKEARCPNGHLIWRK
jgi:hypothetical protein